MHGGMKIYRGAAAAARHYVEADRSRADDYYLAEGSGVAMRFVAGIDNPEQRVTIERRADMDGATYEQWVAGYDVGDRGGEGAAADGRQGRAVRRGHRQRPEDLVARGRASPRDRRGLRRRSDGGGRGDHRLARLARDDPRRVREVARCRCRSSRSRQPSYATSPPGPATRIGTCISRSTRGSGRAAPGGDSTPSACATAWRRSTGSGTQP